jgi:hypothetical protein
MDRSTQRMIGAIGLVFVALTVTPLTFAPPPPPGGASATDVVNYYTSHRSALLVGGWIGALGLYSSVFFFGGLVALFKRGEGEGGWLWLVALIGSVGALATILFLTVIALLLPYSAASTNQDLAKVLNDVAALAFVLYLIPAAAQLVAFGVGGLRRQFLVPWVGYVSLLVALISLIASVGLFVQSDPFKAGAGVTLAAFAGQIIWWIVVSLVLLIRPQTAPALAAVPAVAETAGAGPAPAAGPPPAAAPKRARGRT